MPPPLYINNCNYTPVSTIGTQTINSGPAAPGQGVASPEVPGVFYGYNAVSTGTAGMVCTYYDCIPPGPGQGTATTTNTLFVGTATAPGQTLQPLNGMGVRYRGALILVTSGTAGAGNSLWD